MRYSLYIHVPFCAKKCDYCDFVSFQPKGDCFARYADALLREAKPWHGEIETMYWGGGTPSILPIPVMEKIMAGLREQFTFLEGERTIEANPETVTDEKLKCWKKMGFNRLSMGLQAAQGRFSSVLGRKCDCTVFERAYRLAIEAGFERISGDLMTGLPGQTKNDLLESVDFLSNLGINHISIYELTLHEHTPLGKKVKDGLLRQPEDDEDRAMFRVACKRLADKGFHRYEISNFAKPHQESQHNLVYWRRKPYLGLGPSAASLIKNQRWTNTFSLEAYLENPFAHEEEETLSPNEEAFEAFMLGLRLTEGIGWKEFSDIYHFDLQNALGDRFAQWACHGLARVTEDGIQLTDTGLDVQNPLLVDCMEAFGMQ